ALDRALALAERVGADLVIANDPDADRCAVAVEGRVLTGDEMGALLADHLLRAGVRGRYASTIVSSSLLEAMCAAYGMPFSATLTGFKWIVRSGPDLVFGYEEALGYAVAPDIVRDKDGISAALLIADLAATLKATGSSLPQRLAEIESRYGVHATGQVSIRVAELAQIQALMARLRSAPPASLAGRPVASVEDLRPDADVLRLRAEGIRVVIRPSGTEPKVKAYLQVIERGPRARTVAAERLEALRSQIAELLGQES
ncbi:MAG TPA: phospho-sugar mutase, partial [Mycobacteriales bacterium]|nr:phospho-sugar mutase [Mycobacteriales bacterium]